MDFTALIKKSFTLAWNNRVLWLFGLLAGSMSAVGGYNSTFPSFSFDYSSKNSSNKISAEAVKHFQNFVQSIPTQTWIILIIIFTLVIVLLLIIGIFVSSWASSALAYSTLNMHHERPTFKKGSRAGLQYWWRFYLLTLTLGLAVLAFILLLALPLLFLFLADLKTLMAIYFFVGVIVLIFSLFIVAIFSSLLTILGQRLIIHRGLGVLESIRVAGSLIKKHLGETLLTYFLGVALNFGFGFVLLIALIPIALVILVLFFINPWLIIPALIPAIMLLMVFTGFWQAYSSVYWTLFYQHLTALEGW